MSRVKYTQQSQRWIVKIGSALLTQDGKGLDYASIADWASQIAELRQQGIEVVLVSSGSIAEGMSRMGWSQRPTALPELHADDLANICLKAMESPFTKETFNKRGFYRPDRIDQCNAQPQRAISFSLMLSTPSLHQHPDIKYP